MRGRIKTMAEVKLMVLYPHPADPTQFDTRSKNFDAKAKAEDPPWLVVDIELDRVFKSPVTLDEMRDMPELADMMLLRRGARLSIQPVSADEWKAILKRGKRT